MADLTPLERLMQDQLAKAGKGNESMAVMRAWRHMALDALADALSKHKEHHLGVLGVVVHATELYGYTLMTSGMAGADVSLRFAHQGIADILEYLGWCHAFFDHLGVIAEELPPAATSGMNIMTTAKANAAILAQLLSQLSDESDKVLDSEEEGRRQGNPNAMGVIGISTDTFQALGRALSSVCCAWFSPAERKRFIAGIGQGAAELGELHDLVRMHVAQCADEPDAVQPAITDSTEDGTKP